MTRVRYLWITGPLFYRLSYLTLVHSDQLAPQLGGAPNAPLLGEPLTPIYDSFQNYEEMRALFLDILKAWWLTVQAQM